MNSDNEMFNQKFSLKGRVALVTGAGGLLGYEHCFALLESGAFVVLTDIDASALNDTTQRLRETFAPSAMRAKVMDVCSEQSINETHGSLKSDGLVVSILVNNASVNPKVSSEGEMGNASRLENFSLDEWSKQINVGLTGAFLCSKTFGTALQAVEQTGVILNIASDLSVIAPDQTLYFNPKKTSFEQNVKPVTYSVVKTGLIGLTRYLSTYWADKGIRCNALSPGGVFNNQNEEFVRKVSAKIPMGRMANVDEYRSTIQYLCSDASSYMNGQNIVIDGGRSVW